MSHGIEKDAEIKAVKIELPQLSISAIDKSKLRERFAKVEKTQLEEQKAHQKAESKKAVDTIIEYFKDPGNKDKQELCVKLPISANAKAVNDVLTHIKTKDKSKTVYVFAADKDKVIHGCHVSEVSYFGCPGLFLGKIVRN